MMHRMRSVDERVADVRRVLAAARALPTRAGLVDELVRTTGLSREGVLRGLAEHLEVDASDEELASLLRAAGTTEEVHVVLSANVFVAPLRAVALARAAAARVVVRPSSREPAFARALLAELADPEVTLMADLDVASIAQGEMHVYGRDATIAAIAARLAPGVVLRGHGAGMGIAIVGEDPDVDAAAFALARDVVPFDQRGCLSPRVAVVLGDAARAATFGEALARALDDEARRTPRGEVSDDERAEARRYAETMRFAGHVTEGASYLVGVGQGLAVPPPGRHVHVVAASSWEAARELLAPVARAVVTLGVSEATPTVHEATRTRLGLAHARLARLGRMQRPPLDGPVDLRA